MKSFQIQFQLSNQVNVLFTARGSGELSINQFLTNQAELDQYKGKRNRISTFYGRMIKNQCIWSTQIKTIHVFLRYIQRSASSFLTGVFLSR
jgi:hypothetical protein